AFDIVSDANDIAKLKETSENIKQLCDVLLDETDIFRRRYRMSGEPVPIDLRGEIEEAIRSIARPSGVLIDYETIPVGIKVNAHPRLLSEVFRNMLWNSIQAMSGSGKV